MKIISIGCKWFVIALLPFISLIKATAKENFNVIDQNPFQNAFSVEDMIIPRLDENTYGKKITQVLRDLHTSIIHNDQELFMSLWEKESHEELEKKWKSIRTGNKADTPEGFLSHNILLETRKNKRGEYIFSILNFITPPLKDFSEKKAIWAKYRQYNFKLLVIKIRKTKQDAYLVSDEVLINVEEKTKKNDHHTRDILFLFNFHNKEQEIGLRRELSAKIEYIKNELFKLPSNEFKMIFRSFDFTSDPKKQKNYQLLTQEEQQIVDINYAFHDGNTQYVHDASTESAKASIRKKLKGEKINSEIGKAILQATSAMLLENDEFLLASTKRIGDKLFATAYFSMGGFYGHYYDIKDNQILFDTAPIKGEAKKFRSFMGKVPLLLWLSEKSISNIKSQK